MTNRRSAARWRTWTGISILLVLVAGTVLFVWIVSGPSKACARSTVRHKDAESGMTVTYQDLCLPTGWIPTPPTTGKPNR